MMEKQFSAQISNLDAVHAFINQVLKKMLLSKKTVQQIELAVEEVFVNICRYAYPKGKGSTWISCTQSGSPPVFTVRFSDRGLPFNPLTLEDPDTSTALRHRREGGLGIFMAKKTMDDIHYEYRDGSNILTLTKKL